MESPQTRTRTVDDGREMRLAAVVVSDSGPSASRRDEAGSEEGLATTSCVLQSGSSTSRSLWSSGIAGWDGCIVLILSWREVNTRVMMIPTLSSHMVAGGMNC